jgi:hypothetical protein
MELSDESKAIVNQFTKQDIILFLAIKALAKSCELRERDWLKELTGIKEKLLEAKEITKDDLTYLDVLIEKLMNL